MLVFFFLWISLCSLAYFLVKSRFLCLIVHYYAEGSRLNGIRDDVRDDVKGRFKRITQLKIKTWLDLLSRTEALTCLRREIFLRILSIRGTAFCLAKSNSLCSEEVQLLETLVIRKK